MPDAKNDLKTKLREKFIELSSSSSLHGYPNMFKTNHWPVRLMWLLFFLASATLCVFMVYRSVNDFLSFDVVNKIRDYSEIPMAYPAITFCNVNPFINKNSDELILKYVPDAFNVSYLNTNYDANSTSYDNATFLNASENIDYNWDILVRAQLQAMNKAMDPDYGDENRKKLWYPLDQILIDCVYNGKNCNESDFSWHYMYDFGSCYQFNTGKDLSGNSLPIKKSYISGDKSGLYLELYAGGDGESIYSLQPDSGMVVFIHNQSSKPVVSEGIRLKQNSLINIIMKKVFTQREPDPYSDCQDLNDFKFNKTLYNAIIESGSSFKQKLCFDLCLQQVIIKKCGCYDLKYLKILSVGSCLNLTQLECANTEYLSFVESDIDSLCSEYCPLECDSQYFEYKISTNYFPTGSYTNILSLNPAVAAHLDTYEDLGKNILALNIYYDNLQYSLLSEAQKTSIFDIIAIIGGIFTVN